jgi:hypothetical protein
MATKVRNTERLLAVILAMGKVEFEGELEEAFDELFKSRLELIDDPQWLRYTPNRLTFESELRSIKFHLDALSWTHDWHSGHGSYVTKYRITDRPLLMLMVEEARTQDPDLIVRCEGLAPEFEQLLLESARHRRELVINYDPTDNP